VSSKPGAGQAATAYLAAYPNCSNGNSAEAAASRLLRRVKPILDRVLELQAEQAKRTQRKIDISRDRIARNLDLASTIAQEERNVAGIVASEMGIAKVFGQTLGKGYCAAWAFPAPARRQLKQRYRPTTHSSPYETNIKPPKGRCFLIKNNQNRRLIDMA
jgi:5-methylcytosine-specific restriction endonuclease McrBC regulatory subunit McrC